MGLKTYKERPERARCSFRFPHAEKKMENGVLNEPANVICKDAEILLEF